MDPIKTAERETAPQDSGHISAQPPIQLLPPALTRAPILDFTTPYEQAVKIILVFYLEQIQQITGRIKQEVTADDITILQYYIRSARRVLNNMGEQLDVTDLSPIPTDLRWLSKCNRTLLEWYKLIDQAEKFLSEFDRDNKGVNFLLQEWDAERKKSYDDLLCQINSRRYERFEKAAKRMCQTDRAGIFAKKATRQKLCYVLPSMVWEQYQLLCILKDNLESPKRKQIRQIARQTRNFYHLLAHFKTVLGEPGARCIEYIFPVEQFFRKYDSLSLAAIKTRELAANMDKAEYHSSLKAFLDAKKDEKKALAGQLPALFRVITSNQFRSDLGQAVIGP
ncbi:MAG: hypothetical protein JXA42_06240 [Anaerolineales bacterium]|nr:hypothetical protein [Anaerolineales bacterium]